MATRRQAAGLERFQQKNKAQRNNSASLQKVLQNTATQQLNALAAQLKALQQSGQQNTAQYQALNQKALEIRAAMQADPALQKAHEEYALQPRNHALEQHGSVEGDQI